MLKPFHVHSLAMELDAFQSETRPLFMSGLAVQFNLPTCTDYAMPWQLIDGICT